MDTIKEKLGKMAEQLALNKGRIATLVIAVLAILIFLLDSVFFHGQLRGLLLGFDGILFVLVILSMVFVAGFVVVRSLFHVAAGLSLLIFLSDSYCAVPSYTMSGDNALKGLLMIGLVYVTVDFLKILYKGLREDLKTIGEVKSSAEKVITVILFVIFASVFVAAAYQVVSPIVHHFCIYHR